MPTQTHELLSAERRARALVARNLPAPGETWRFAIGDGADARALMAAARWAARLGATVEATLASPAAPSPAWNVLADSCRRQGLVLRDGGDGGNRLYITGKGGEREVSTLPDAAEAWRSPLSEAGGMVKPPAPDAPRLSCAQSRAIDRRAIHDYGVPGVCLMENAAVAGVMVAMAMLGSRPPRVVIAAGGGNNGGDGLAMARGLAELGAEVAIALLKPAESLSGDAGINLSLLSDYPDIALHPIHDRPEELRNLLKNKELVIDGLLGTGFRGGLSPAFRLAIDLIHDSGIQVLALDIPSGLNGDSGAVDEVAVRADHTITFAALKTGLVVGRGPEHCGKVYVGDIGAPTAAFG